MCLYITAMCLVSNKLYYYVCEAESSSTLNKIAEGSVQDVHSIIKSQRRKWLHIHQLSHYICCEIMGSPDKKGKTFVFTPLCSGCLTVTRRLSLTPKIVGF